MSVREYIGARYVPVFADPIQWDPTSIYEPLTVVTDQGASYVSRRMVPEGIQLDNTDYWVLWADFNAQLQHYIDEVDAFDGRIDALEDALPIADYSSQSTVSDAIDAFTDKFPVITADIADGAITSAKIANGTIATADIADGAITSAKIADGTIATADIANGAISGIKTAGKYIACIGDSFGNASDEWPTILANKFGYGLINECTNGAGLISTTYSQRTFLVQLEAIKQNANLTNGNVDYIIVFGGVNDWNNASASANEIKNAVNNFMDAYYAISASVRPKLIFAYGSIGWARQDRYIGYDEWLSDISTLVNAGSHCTGWVENVCYWLMAESSVYGSDNLHPNEKGEKLIASYLSECICGTYSGVHKVLHTTTVENASTGKVTVHFDNGISSVTGKLNTASLDFTTGEYFRVANFSDYTFAFGDGSAGVETENMFIQGSPYRIASNSSGQIGIMRWVFNVKNGGVFLQVIGNKASFNLADNILTGSPAINVGSGIGM